MSGLAREAVWRRLADAGLVQGDAPPAPATPAPWYVRTMLAVAGWIGALFLLAFVGVGLEFVFDSAGAALVVGALCCIAAYFIFGKLGTNVVAVQFGLAISLAGQVMIIFGLADTLETAGNTVPLLLAIAVLEAVLAFVLDNYVHRTLCTLGATIALGLALRQMGLSAMSPAVIAGMLAAVWLNEHQFGARGSTWRAVGYGLALGALQRDLTIWDYLWHTPVPFMPWMFWARGLLLGAVLLYVVQQLLARHDAAPSSKVGVAALAAAAAFAVATFSAPGVTVSLIIMLLGFAGGNRALFGLGVAGLLGYLSYFYYSLQATLLSKSMILMATGAVLVASWLALRALFGDAPDKETTHA